MALRDRKHEITHPGHRQVGQHLVAVGQTVKLDRAAGRLDQVGVREQHPFGPAGGAGRVEDGRDIRGAASGHFPFVVLGVPAVQTRPGLGDGSQVNQSFDLVVPLQTSGVGVDDRPQFGEAVPDLDELVDLLLVLDHGNPHAGMFANVGNFFGDRILVARNGYGANGLTGSERPIKVRPVVPDDREAVAAIEAQRAESEGQMPDLLGNLGPRPRLPDPEFLLAVGGPITQVLGIGPQKPRECVCSGFSSHSLCVVRGRGLQ